MITSIVNMTEEGTRPLPYGLKDTMGFLDTFSDEPDAFARVAVTLSVDDARYLYPKGDNYAPIWGGQVVAISTPEAWDAGWWSIIGRFRKVYVYVRRGDPEPLLAVLRSTRPPEVPRPRILDERRLEQYFRGEVVQDHHVQDLSGSDHDDYPVDLSTLDERVMEELDTSGFNNWVVDKAKLSPVYDEYALNKYVVPPLLQTNEGASILSDLHSVINLSPVFSGRPALGVRFGFDAPEDGPLGPFFWRLLAPFLVTYFQLSPSTTFNQAAFARALKMLVTDVSPPAAKTRLVVPLLNVHLIPKRLEITQGIALRRLTALEVQRWMNMLGEAPLLQGVDTSELEYAQCALEIASSEMPPEISDLEGRALPEHRFPESTATMWKALWATHLVKSPRIYPLLTEYQVLGLMWQTEDIRAHRTAIFRFHFSDDVERSDEPILADTYRQIASGPSAKTAELALRRWSNAGGRWSDEDRLIDYWIALESLFSPSKEQEISFRASFRAAGFLAKDADERVEIYKRLKQSYGVRSNIVHGDRPRKPNRKEYSAEEMFRLVNLVGLDVKHALEKVLALPSKFDANKLEEEFLQKVWQ